jgi:hypothetical protein
MENVELKITFPQRTNNDKTKVKEKKFLKEQSSKQKA